MRTGYVVVAIYEAFAGNSYMPLPPSLGGKKAIVNVKNRDNECFRWALKAARFPVDQNAERPGKYPKNDGLNWEGIEFPVKVSRIGQFEKQNEGLAINVFGWNDGGLTILRVSCKGKAIPRINLMLIMDEEKSHYCWIKNIGPLLNFKRAAVLLRSLSVALHERESSGKTPGSVRGGKWTPDADRNARNGTHAEV